MKREISILSRLDHPNLIKLYDSIDQSTKVSLIMEYVKGRSLYSYIKKRPRMRISEEEAKVIFR